MRENDNGRKLRGRKNLVSIISKLTKQQLDKSSDDENEESDALMKENNEANDSAKLVESSHHESSRRSKRKPEKIAKLTDDQPTVEVPDENLTIVEAVVSDDELEDMLENEERSDHAEEKIKKKKKKKEKKVRNDLKEKTDDSTAVNCTSCNTSIPTKSGKLCRHPDLNTIMCKKCYKFYSSGKFTKDEYGVEEFCRWCADGGELICCDFCEKAFCKKCIRRNLGKSKLQELLEADENDKWSCFCCDPAPISSMIKMCNKVMRMLEEEKDQHSPYKDKKGREIIQGPNRSERRNILTNLSGKQTVKSETNRSFTKKTYSKCFENGVSSPAEDTDNTKENRRVKKNAFKKESDEARSKTVVTNMETSEDDVEISEEYSEGDETPNSKKKKKGVVKTERNSRVEISSSDSDVPRRKRGNKKQKNDHTNSSSSEDLSCSKKQRRDKERKKKSKSQKKRIESDSSDAFVETKHGKKGKINTNAAASSDDESEEDESTYSSEQDSRDGYIKKNRKGKNKRKSVSSESDSDVEDSVRKRRKKKNLNKSRKVGKWRFRSKKGGRDDSDSDDTSNKENAKKSKSKKKVNKRKKGKVKRKRNEDDDEESDEEDVSPSKKGRKKIRKILDTAKLAEATRHARQLEEERRQRLLKRTENTSFARPDTVDLKEVVLEYKADGKTPLVEVDNDLVKHLKPHQVEGVKFMYDCTIESVERWRKKEEGGGCILAHVMGLGKTLQVVTLIHTLYKSELIELRRVLVVCPLNTVLNWQAEFEKWLNVDERLDVYVLNEVKANNWHRADMMKSWKDHGGILIMGYTMYRIISQCLRIRSKSQKTIFKECLVDPGPELVVCDEGHILRNCKSAISVAMNGIKTKRRIVLTGTPLQNNLVEYHCMVSFVKPNLLGTLKEFSNSFIRPIANGQCADSTPLDVRLMKRRCHVLHKMLEGCVQRKDYAEISRFLPPKFEYVIKVRLSAKQIELYRYYLETFLTSTDEEIKGRGGSLFSDYQALMRIWTHPWSLKLETWRQEACVDFDDTDESLKNFVVESSEEESEEMSWTSDSSDGSKGMRRRQSKNSSEEEESEADSDEDKSEPEVIKNSKPRTEEELDKKNAAKNVKTDPDGPSTSTANAVDDDNDDIVEVKPVVNEQSLADTEINGVKMVSRTLRSNIAFKDPTPDDKEQEWYDKFLTEEDSANVELGSKIVLLLEILADAAALEEKVLVFSHSLISLDVIEMALGGGEIGGNTEDWCRGCDYFRMDGSTSAQMRKRWADIFNDEENKAARLFLISTKAGGLGINLVGASRVIVFDISWNPSHDVQSIFRAYRFGQNKPVFVYRFISQGTMEEKIYDRQVTKLSMSQRVIDEHQIDRHFNANDLAELYRFEPDILEDENEERPTPAVPKDAILAELINRLYPKWIVKYHEHDSLLRNRPEEELTEAERKEAWEHWEQEKQGALNPPQIRAELIQQMVNGVNLQHPNTIRIDATGPTPNTQTQFTFGGPRVPAPPVQNTIRIDATGPTPNSQTQFTFGGPRVPAPPGQNPATLAGAQPPNAGMQRPPNFQQMVLEEQRRRLFEMARRRIEETQRRAREQLGRLQQEEQQVRAAKQKLAQEARQRAEQQQQRIQQQRLREQQEQRLRDQQQEQRLREQQKQREQQQQQQRLREQQQREQLRRQEQQRQQQNMGQQFLQQLLRNRNAYVTQQARPGYPNQSVYQVVVDNNTNNDPVRQRPSQRSPPRIIELPPDA